MLCCISISFDRPNVLSVVASGGLGLSLKNVPDLNLSSGNPNGSPGPEVINFFPCSSQLSMKLLAFNIY